LLPNYNKQQCAPSSAFAPLAKHANRNRAGCVSGGGLMHPNDCWPANGNGVRDGRVVPDMPHIGLDEIAFCSGRVGSTSARPAIGWRSDAPSRVRLL
jgi:hypothetical protein